MPIVELHVLEGYGTDEKRRLHTALTDAVRLIVPASPDAITVMIHEMKAANYSRGGKQRKGAPALGDAGEIVRAFLKTMEAREIEAAEAFLAEDFAMFFPGAQPLHDLEALIKWATQRYRFVKKAYLGFDVMQSSGLEVLVYCRGTLSGEWLDGTPFENIRFIDRFELVEGKISRQDVWNDIAEVKAGL